MFSITLHSNPTAHTLLLLWPCVKPSICHTGGFFSLLCVCPKHISQHSLLSSIEDTIGFLLCIHSYILILLFRCNSKHSSKHVYLSQMYLHILISLLPNTNSIQQSNSNSNPKKCPFDHGTWDNQITLTSLSPLCPTCIDTIHYIQLNLLILFYNCSYISKSIAYNI